MLDKKLLFELDNNSRQSFSELGKKLRTSPQVITYRINRLKQEGIITSFLTALSTLSMGLPVIVKLYVQLSGITKSKEDEIFVYLLSNDHVNWICKTVGEFDLFTAVMVKDVQTFAEFKRNFFNSFGNFISQYEISFMDKAYTLPRNYLLNKKPVEIKSHLIHAHVANAIDKDDKAILRLIANDSRINVIDIAKSLNKNIKTIMVKLRNLENSGTIQGYRINIDRKKLNIRYYKVFMKIRSFEIQQYQRFINFCLAQPYLIHLIECIGKYEIELEMEMPGSEEMHALIKEMRNLYPNMIENISLTEIIEEIKLTWLPKSY